MLCSRVFKPFPSRIEILQKLRNIQLNGIDTAVYRALRTLDSDRNEKTNNLTLLL